MTITDLFEPYIGTKEYDGVIAEIQEWFYGTHGTIVRAPWCATSVSYFANKDGILDQLGGKNENVYDMMKATEKACKETGVGTFYYKTQIPNDYVIKRGTIIFLLYGGGVMKETSSKHVTTAYEDFKYSGFGLCRCLGGNQSDMIRVSQYAQTNIYAIFAPKYEDKPEPEPPKHKTLRRGDKGPEVKELQAALNSLGYRNQYGNSLSVDGSFGPRTEAAVENLQEDQDLEVDGICGPLTWGKIDDLLSLSHVVTVDTELYARKRPGKQYPVVGLLVPGKKYCATRESEDWTFIATVGGWSKTSYLKTK